MNFYSKARKNKMDTLMEVNKGLFISKYEKSSHYRDGFHREVFSIGGTDVIGSTAKLQLDRITTF